MTFYFFGVASHVFSNTVSSVGPARAPVILRDSSFRSWCEPCRDSRSHRLSLSS